MSREGFRVKLERERLSESKGVGPSLKRVGSSSEEKGSESKADYKSEGKSDSK